MSGIPASQSLADELASRLVAQLAARGQTLATAESCTGGWIAQAITSVSGSSEVFPGGIVSYANRAKVDLLGVSQATLDEHGAVSERTVIEMATGARERFHSDYVVAVSGIAGPGGGTADKPVGTVWIAWLGPDGVSTKLCHFEGDREAVRIATVCIALHTLLELS
ncbi:CinA family protein [bacterium]|nr:CinA family protein [bacterium]